MLSTRASPVGIRRRRRDEEKPPMPENLEPILARAEKRMPARILNPGVAVEVEKPSSYAYRIVSPHSDGQAWFTMVMDAIGTGSASVADAFLYQLSELCAQRWHPAQAEGEVPERCPDERELNMALAMVASQKPRNEMEAALAASMVAVHLLTMKTAAAALAPYTIDVRTAATAGKLARTFAILTEAMAKQKGRRTARQSIKVSHEKHIHQHHHQHIHVDQGSADFGGQPHVSGDSGVQKYGRTAQPAGCPALRSEDPAGNVLPLPRDPGTVEVLAARRKVAGSAEG